MNGIYKRLRNCRESALSNRKQYTYKTKKITSSILRGVFFTGMCFAMLYPLFFMLSSTFKTIEDLYNPSVIWVPRKISFEAIRIAADIMDYGTALGRTLSILVPSVLLQLANVLLAGYGFARFKFKGKGICFMLLIFTIIVPVQSYIIPLYANFRNFDFFLAGRAAALFTGEPALTNLLDLNIAFYLQAALGMGIRSGLYIFIVRQFFRGFPAELEEAAMIDGCGPLRTFLRVMLPNAVSLIATVAVFSIVWYWNDHFISSMLLRSDFPVSVNLTNIYSVLYSSDTPVPGYSAQEVFLFREPIMAAGCILVSAPLIAFYIVAQRFFTEGIERSGIVG